MQSENNPFRVVIGQQIAHVWRGYRSVFFLEFGQVREGKGEITVGLDACPWRLLQHDKEVLTHFDALEAIDKELPTLIGNTVHDVVVDKHLKRTRIVLSNNIIIETDHSGSGSAWYLLAPGYQVTVSEGGQITTKNF